MKSMTGILLAALLAGLAPEARAEASLDPLLDRLSREGEAASLPAGLARLLDLKSGAPVRQETVSAEETQDHVTRAIRVVLASDEPGAKPVSLVLVARRDLPKEGRSELYQLRLKPSGQLEQFLFGKSRVDAFGNPVRGSDAPRVQSTDSPESRVLVRRELDFWLARERDLSPKKGAPRLRGGRVTTTPPIGGRALN